MYIDGLRGLYTVQQYSSVGQRNDLHRYGVTEDLEPRSPHRHHHRYTVGTCCNKPAALPLHVGM